MFLKENEDLLLYQGFEVNLRTENNRRIIELSVYKDLSVLIKRAERPAYIDVEV